MRQRFGFGSLRTAVIPRQVARFLEAAPSIKYKRRSVSPTGQDCASPQARESEVILERGSRQRAVHTRRIAISNVAAALRDCDPRESTALNVPSASKRHD